MEDRLSHVDELEKKYKRQEEECSLLKANCNELKEKCTNLDTRCESLQRSVQILSKESKWEYSAPYIPDSHWENLGFDEDYINQMQKFLADIKRYTCRLRSGKCGLSALDFGLDDEALLQHDDILLPHWKELANALQLCNVDGIPELSITNIQLTTSVIDLLTPALKGKQIDDFSLYNNDFEDTHKGIEFVAECIKSNNELERFYLTSNQIDNMVYAHHLIEAIINNPSIDDIRLENCLRGGVFSINGYEAVRPLFASDRTWDRLDLENNNIQTKGDTAIPDYIASNPPLQSLLLSGNKLNDNDAILIASSLKGNNTNLKSLHMQNNTGITDIGRNALIKAIYDPTSLNSMSDCNHACVIYIDGHMKNVPRWGSNEGAGKPQIKRSTKIYQLLFERNKEGSNVQHLNAEFEDDEEDSLKLVPKVLERVHLNYDSMIQNAEDDDSNSEEEINPSPSYPLSIMFEVLRGWKMPELYEKRS